ncbi:pentapeptide repeat-containing protein [Actinoplanes sp. NPDC026670]|uniref:pentapeptide repeat-containing protein n=1 Tax=Actinoplanes sp. NPDC026670 TaxID=3154700 RepID=UPI0033DFFAFA
MLLERVSDTEQRVCDAFRVGAEVNLSQTRDRDVRAEVLRFLLLGGGPSAEAGDMPSLYLNGARVTGRLALPYAEVAVPIGFEDCEFTEKIDFYGARLRQVSFRGCQLRGIIASNAVFGANLRLLDSRSEGTLQLVGATITNALLLDSTELIGPDMALDGMRLRVGADVVAHHGFRSQGELRLTNAEVGGSLRLEGATLENPGGVALRAQDLRVGAIANFCEGFIADGSISLSFAQVTSRLCLEGATLRGDASTRLDLRHVQTRDLVLLPTVEPPGRVDLSHAEVGVLRDDSDTWAAEMHLDGMRYESLSHEDDQGKRLDWLRRDPRGYRPQAYGQLASVFHAAGREDDARGVLLAGEQRRRENLAPLGRLWGYLQDVTVGYGYRPGRAFAWLLTLLFVGTVVFQLHPPRAAEAAKAPEFVAVAYAADLILPVVDLGQQSNYLPQGATAWLAYFLILSGIVLASTITAAAARTLRRN